MVLQLKQSFAIEGMQFCEEEASPKLEATSYPRVYAMHIHIYCYSLMQKWYYVENQLYAIMPVRGPMKNGT